MYHNIDDKIIFDISLPVLSADKAKLLRIERYIVTSDKKFGKVLKRSRVIHQADITAQLKSS